MTISASSSRRAPTRVRCRARSARRGRQLRVAGGSRPDDVRLGRAVEAGASVAVYDPVAPRSPSPRTRRRLQRHAAGVRRLHDHRRTRPFRVSAYTLTVRIPAGTPPSTSAPQRIRFAPGTDNATVQAVSPQASALRPARRRGSDDGGQRRPRRLRRLDDDLRPERRRRRRRTPRPPPTCRRRATTSSRSATPAAPRPSR